MVETESVNGVFEEKTVELRPRCTKVAVLIPMLNGMLLIPMLNGMFSKAFRDV